MIQLLGESTLKPVNRMMGLTPFPRITSAPQSLTTPESGTTLQWDATVDIGPLAVNIVHSVRWQRQGLCNRLTPRDNVQDVGPN